MKRSFTISYNQKVKITVLVILALFALSGFVSYKIRSLEEEAAWYALNRSATRINDELSRRIDVDREVLLTFANIISKQDNIDSQLTQEIIDDFSANTLMEHIALLLPGDKVLWPHQAPINAKGILSFEEEVKHGMHITDRLVDLRDRNNFILRNFVPVQKNGKTVAMLYGVINLRTLPAFMNQNIYQGQAVYFIIDGDNGDFILNTHRSKLGNMWDIAEREIKSGDSNEVMRAKLAQGQSGYNIIKSAISGQFGCFYYKPSTINNWRVAILVPEKIALSRVYQTNKLLLFFLIAEFIMLVGYFIWLQRTSRKELQIQQRLADRDLLTGCLNRNCFEKFLAQDTNLNKKHISCVYMDVNGLHELNNTQGHAAGDKMLQVVAKELQKVFGENDVYRIGGDEFVVITIDKEDKDVEQLLTEAIAAIKAQNYFVSTGHCHSHGEISIDELLKMAEKRMYDDKRDFYSRAGNDRRARS